MVIVLFIIEKLLMLGLFVHLAFRFIQFYKSIQSDAYEINKIHTFICSKCEKRHTVNGQQLKELRWKPRIRKFTPLSQSTAIRINCPHCHQKAGQIIQYDHNITKGLGLFRLQMNESQKEHLIRFLLLGFAPILVTMVVWRMIKAMVILII